MEDKTIAMKISLPFDTEEIPHGNVYVMTHSFFSDVIRIGCTPEDAQAYTHNLSEKSPGKYTLVYSIECDNPCKIKQQVRKYLEAQKYVNEFYQVSANTVKKLLEREVLRIPTFEPLLTLDKTPC